MKNKKMKNKNGFAINKSFGLFVVITIGVVLAAYIAFGIISLEIRAERTKNKNHQANKVYSVIWQGNEQQAMEKNIDMITGTVLTIEDNIVTVETDHGDGTLSKVQLLVGRSDLALIQVGDEMTAKLFSKVAVSKIGDNVLEVSNIIVQEQ